MLDLLVKYESTFKYAGENVEYGTITEEGIDQLQQEINESVLHKEMELKKLKKKL